MSGLKLLQLLLSIMSLIVWFAGSLMFLSFQPAPSEGQDGFSCTHQPLRHV